MRFGKIHRAVTKVGNLEHPVYQHLWQRWTPAAALRHESRCTVPACGLYPAHVVSGSKASEKYAKRGRATAISNYVTIRYNFMPTCVT